MFRTLKEINNFTGAKVRFYLVVSIFAGIAWFFCELSFVYVFQYFLYSLKLIDRNQLSFNPEILAQVHISGPIALIAFGFFRLVANFVKNVMSSYVQHTFIQEKRSQVLTIALAKAGSLPTGQIISYFSEIVSQAGTVIFYVSNAIIAAVSLGLFIIAGFILLPYEMAISMGLLMLFILPYKYFSKNIVAYGKVLTTEWEEVNNSLVNLIKNNVFIKIYNLNKTVTDKGTASLIRYEHSFKKYTINHSLVTLIPPAYGLIIIAFVSSLFIKEDRSDPIKLISFLYIFLRMAQAASETLGTLAFLKLNRFAYLKLMSWFQTPTSTSQGTPIASFKEIQLRDVSFSYDDSESILKNINLSFRPGDFVVIKGISGSGKSTLLSLILGLQKPTHGSVLIDDISHQEYTLSPAIGYVGPTPFLVNGTVMENLKLGSTKQFSDSEALACLDKVLLGDKVRSLKLGIHEVLNEDAQLSTGQKQRLCIARILLHSPGIIILDEATANLDPGSEKEIIRCIKETYRNNLVIVVTHKDSFDATATKSINLNEQKR